MLTIQYAMGPVFSTADNNEIDLIVKFVEIANELPFTATPFDPEPYGVELFNNALAGEYGEVAPYVPPPPPPEPTNLDQPESSGLQNA